MASTTSTRNNNQSNVRNSNNQARRQPAPRQEIRYTQGNLTYVWGGNILESKAQTILAGFNTQGDPSHGLARDLCRKFPALARTYKHLCQQDLFQPGNARRVRVTEDQQVIMMAIWKMQEFGPKAEWIISAFSKICDAMDNGLDVESVATVKPGCFNHETSLNWEEIGPVVAGYLSYMDVPAEIYLGKDDLAFFPVEDEHGESKVISMKVTDVTEPVDLGDDLP